MNVEKLIFFTIPVYIKNTVMVFGVSGMEKSKRLETNRSRYVKNL